MEFIRDLDTPDWMILDAVRYAIGRQSYQVGITCAWLKVYWDKLPEELRRNIQRDVEEAFERDSSFLEDDTIRRAWEGVRRLWRKVEK